MNFFKFTLKFSHYTSVVKRYLSQFIQEDLQEKMVFLGGPRQVGKTTLALSLLKNGHEKHPAYLNWDVVPTKKSLMRGELPSDQDLVILDKIHKYKEWRNLIKGFYDTYKSERKFLITGSARLDYYRKGGDSLQGRYHYHRLHPFSLYEISKNPKKEDLIQLLQFGGFPEPFLKASTRHYKRWQKERLSRVVQEDLVSLESVKDISSIDLLVHLLPERVGSPLSVNNLSQDLSVAQQTADHWIQILENVYLCFRITPYGLPHLRVMKKERKLYLWDWSLCLNEAARFENLVASNLLKFCHKSEDTEGEEMDLHFLRDSQKREIDFVVTKNKKPLFAVECKSGDKKISPRLTYFSSRTSIPCFYQVHMGDRDYEVKEHRTRVLPFTSFAKILKI